MEQSLYIEEVKSNFESLANRVVERLNDTTDPNALSYLHRQMLTKEYSPDLKWGSVSISGSIVAADVVALDVPLPLKKRDSIGSAKGDIKKQGIEYALREKELTDLGILSRTPGRKPELLRRLFNDTTRVIQAQYEALEYQFLLGLSSGVTVISDALNVGTGVRIDYGYLTENKFGVPTLWSNVASTPFSDISLRMMNKAALDGNTINVIMLDLATFNNIAKTDQAKQMFAFSLGYTGGNVPVPTLSQLNQASVDRYGFRFQIVNRSVRFQKNGVNTTVKPGQQVRL